MARVRKSGPRDVGASLKGQSSPSRNVAGNPGSSMPQKPIPGPARTGGPIALQRALKKKG
jgi:hypothetical protein